MRVSRKTFQKGSNFDNFFFGGPTLTAGIVALWFYRESGPVLLRNPVFFFIFFRFFKVGSEPPVHPPLYPRMLLEDDNYRTV